MSNLTPKEQRVLQFIAGHIEATGGISPSFQQIADMLGSGSKGHASRQVTSLNRAGAITALKNRARVLSVNVAVPIPRSPDGEPLYFVEVR